MGCAFERHRGGGEMSRALEPPLAHLRKHRQRREVLNALVLRIFLSRGLDCLFSLLLEIGSGFPIMLDNSSRISPVVFTTVGKYIQGTKAEASVPHGKPE